MNTLTFQNVYNTSQNANFNVGERASTPDGRDWVYIKASTAIPANSVAVPVAVTSVGATIVSSANNLGQIVYITKAAAGWTAGQFANGYVLINGGTGDGQYAKIISNTATTLVLAPENALTTALDGTSTMTIWTQFLCVSSLVTSKLQNATGVTQVAFAQNDFGWALTRGIGGVIATTTLTAGAGFCTGAATAGAVIPLATTNGTFDAQTVGVCIVPQGASGVPALAFVTLDA